MSCTGKTVLITSSGNDIQTVNTHGDNRFFLSVVQRTIQPLALCVYPEEWEGAGCRKEVARKSSRIPWTVLRTTHQPQELGQLEARDAGISPKSNSTGGSLAPLPSPTYNFPVTSMDLIIKLGGNGYPAYK